MGEQLRSLDQITATAMDMALRFGPKLVAALLILVAGHFAGRWCAGALARALGKLRLEPPVVALAKRFAYLAALALFAIMALQNLGVELLPLIAGLSIAGAGVALAMQGLLGNLVAGLVIIFARPFRVGDYISIVDEEGEVLEIRLFSTALGHPDRSRVVIPNRKIVGEILHNYGAIRQQHIEVGVTYDADVAAALELVMQTLHANPRVLPDPAPLARVGRLDEWRVVLVAAPWVRVPDYVVAGGELRQAILEAFRERGIPVPTPRQDVRLLAQAGAAAPAQPATAA